MNRRVGFKVPRDAEGWIKYAKLKEFRAGKVHSRDGDHRKPAVLFMVREHAGGYAVAKVQADKFGCLRVVAWLATYRHERDADEAAKKFQVEHARQLSRGLFEGQQFQPSVVSPLDSEVQGDSD